MTYRVFRTNCDTNETGYVYRVHEVNTDHDGNIVDYWPMAMAPLGSTTAALERDLRDMLNALNKPVLEWVDEVAEEVE